MMEARDDRLIARASLAAQFHGVEAARHEPRQKAPIRRRAPRKPIGALSPRQCQVIAMVAEGKLNKEIAYALGIAEGTVKAHLFTVSKAFGLVAGANRVTLAMTYLAALSDEDRVAFLAEVYP